MRTMLDVRLGWMVSRESHRREAVMWGTLSLTVTGGATMA